MVSTLFRIESVTKSHGSIRALDNLSISVPAGATGLLGQMGTAKSPP
jgi:ABC-type uncharacterized transport system ATPase subunit